MQGTISSRLKYAIEKSKLSYIELEKRTGIPKSAIQRYASGDTDKLPIDRIEKLANVLDYPLSFFIGTLQKQEHNYFSDPEEALAFLLKNPIMMAYGGYDVHSMNEEQITKFAQETLEYILFLTQRFEDK